MPSFNLEWFLPFFQGALFCLLAMAMHEGGHIVAALALGVKVKSIGFCWKGIYLVREAGSPVKNVLVSLAGPLANFVLMLFWHHLPIFVLANFCCGLANLLPIRGSDGDRILTCLGEMREERPVAQ